MYSSVNTPRGLAGGWPGRRDHTPSLAQTLPPTDTLLTFHQNFFTNTARSHSMPISAFFYFQFGFHARGPGFCQWHWCSTAGSDVIAALAALTAAPRTPSALPPPPPPPARLARLRRGLGVSRGSAGPPDRPQAAALQHAQRSAKPAAHSVCTARPWASQRASPRAAAPSHLPPRAATLATPAEMLANPAGTIITTSAATPSIEHLPPLLLEH